MPGNLLHKKSTLKCEILKLENIRVLHKGVGSFPQDENS